MAASPRFSPAYGGRRIRSGSGFRSLIPPGVSRSGCHYTSILGWFPHSTAHWAQPSNGLISVLNLLNAHAGAKHNMHTQAPLHNYAALPLLVVTPPLPEEPS
jgi:hypothetical protein